jgi:hypothetical protein
MLLLAGVHPSEPHSVSVDDGQSMLDLNKPEVEVRHLSSELMPIQCSETR